MKKIHSSPKINNKFYFDLKFFFQLLSLRKKLLKNN
jgi:hypothetical protein